MTASRTHRLDVAYQMVLDHFLTNVVNQAEYYEKVFQDLSDNPTFTGQYYVDTSYVLDLIELQELLEMNDDEVIEWVSNVPAVTKVMREQGLMLGRVITGSKRGCQPLLGFVLTN